VNEIFGWGLCQQLHFGCASGHVAKILNHIINFMRLDSVSQFSTAVRVGFGILMIMKAGAASCHCAFFKPTFIPEQNLCFPTLEPKSTDFTYGMEVVIDVAFSLLFLYKLYKHLDQFRGTRAHVSSALRPMYRQFCFEVIPFMFVSMMMNSFILSGHFGPYSICFIYFDFAFSVRVTNDLVFLSRLSSPDNVWTHNSIAQSFSMDEYYSSSSGPTLAPRSDPRSIAATIEVDTVIHGDNPSNIKAGPYWSESSDQYAMEAVSGDRH